MDDPEEDPATTPTVEAGLADVAATVMGRTKRAPDTAAQDDTLTSTPGGATGGLVAGRRLGRYVVEHRLGAGGMGEVLAAHDPELDRRVAIKLLRGEVGDHGAERLRREARTMARLSHRNLVAVHDVGEHDGHVFLAMELLDGGTLRGYERGRTWQEILRAYLDAGRGLAAAHDAGVVHRDFKPDNVLCARDGRVAVTDFGIARRRSHAASADDAPGAAHVDPSLTRTGAMVGTPLYMPPEQLDGAVADARSDQFAFAVALWEALYGAHPLVPKGADLDALVAAMAKGDSLAPPPGPVPAHVARALIRALHPDPAARWPSLRDLLQALDVDAAPRRHVVRWAAVAVVGLGGVAAATIWFARSSRDGGGGAALPVAAVATDAASAPALVTAAAPTASLTQLGGCAYSPAFVDDDTVVFDLTRDGAVDLWRLELDGGEPTRLTSTPGWDWRATRGTTSDEVLYIRQDETHATVHRLDLVTGATSQVLPVAAATVYARGAYYFAPPTEPALRVLRGTVEEVVLTLPHDQGVDTMALAPDESRLVMLLATHKAAPQLCTVELDRPTLVCSQAPVKGARPAFSSRGDAVYALMREGIARVDLVGDRVTTVVPGVAARGGIAVSPSGRELIYSDCRGRRSLVDLAGDRAAPLIPEDIAIPTLGRNGILAYVREEPDRQTIKLRDARGLLFEVITRSGATFSGLALSPDGDRLVYAMGHKDTPGLYTTMTTPGSAPNRLTEDAGDRAPLFVGDEIVFNRFGDDGAPTLMRMKLDGSDVRVASRRPRMTIASDPAHARVLLASPAMDFLYWWDPVTGRESAGPPLPGGFRDRRVSLSPGGQWLLILTGANGNVIDRVDLAAARPTLERVEVLAEDVTSFGGVVDDRGHPLVVLSQWTGELWRVPAPRDQAW
ncbi:MAG TPA: protein kinase [Kofleriaceae bacterium]|nr:protein kinase [Kofleriaceae bacterium]